MESKSHIVSFDDAKRYVRTSSRSSSNASSSSASRGRVRVASDRSSDRSSGRSSDRSLNRSTGRSLDFLGVFAQEANVSSRSRMRQPARGSSSHPRRSHADSNAVKACEGERGEAVSSARFSLVDKVSRARRAYTKQRADKRFTKQYGSSESATCRSDAGAPRAAVYKTEMGVSHKKAARMQGSAPSSRGGSAASKKRRSVSPKLIVSAAIAACMLFSFVFLYEPAKLYYQEVRERDRLQAEYALIAERNEVIQDEVDVLSTTAGIEDRAHEEFGWVNSGESTANVIGVEVEDTSSFTASVVPGSVEAPDTWYSFLDSFFGVEK